MKTLPASRPLPPGPSVRLPADISDTELVPRILAGDTALFELIMRRYNRLLFRAVRAIVEDDDEARDVVQAAYIRAYYCLDQFRGASAIKSWLARIAVNEAYARRRRRSGPVRSSEELASLPALDGDEPERSNMSRETILLVQRAIEQLPEEYRVVFMLRGVEQLSVAETAAALHIKEATVKTRFHRARALLRLSIGTYSDDAVHGAFPFDGSHCDEIVAAVLADLHARQQ